MLMKERRLNNLLNKYDLSIEDMKESEEEQFTDGGMYESNIDNLTYVVLDRIADYYKLEVANYVKRNTLEAKTGMDCISKIKISIKDGEFQEPFKEFDFQDTSDKNIALFIKKYRKE